MADNLSPDACPTAALPHPGPISRARFFASCHPIAVSVPLAVIIAFGIATLAAFVLDPRIVHELFTNIAPSLAEREGGYTRITKVGSSRPRLGSISRREKRLSTAGACKRCDRRRVRASMPMS